MNYFVKPSRLAAIGLLFIVLGMAKSVAGSAISGTVYDNRRNALASVNVELLDQYHALKKYTITDGIGRYSFDGLSDGDWFVRVLPFRYDFDEQVQSVTIYTVSQSSAGNPNGSQGYTNEVVDFVLLPRRGTLAEAQAEVVFAQEIPDPARKAFENGQKLLKKGKIDEAITNYQQAVKIFPDYFLANHYLGTLYFNQKDYEHAAPPLIKAAQVNDKSGVTLYYLGCTLYQLHYNKAAIVALQSAAIQIPSSPAVFTTLGSAQRTEREYKDAEKSLLQAKKLAKTDNAELYKELAALYGEIRQYDKAAENLEQMLKSGTFSEADTAKIKEQIRIWKDLSTKQPSKFSS